MTCKPTSRSDVRPWGRSSQIRRDLVNVLRYATKSPKTFDMMSKVS